MSSPSLSSQLEHWAVSGFRFNASSLFLPMIRSTTRNRNRSLNRRTRRSLNRHATRMLGGARRPRPENDLAVVCRALNLLIKLDKSLYPYMEEQQRNLEDWLWNRTFHRALANVYARRSQSPDNSATLPADTPEKR